MSLVRMDELLLVARKKNFAIAAFECWNSANIYAIAEGAAKANIFANLIPVVTAIVSFFLLKEANVNKMLIWKLFLKMPKIIIINL